MVVLDGWGVAPDGPGNAVSQGRDTGLRHALGELPARHDALDLGLRDAGLPPRANGELEVGHPNLGAGAIVKQDLARIDEAIADGSFFENEALKAACARALESGRLHAIAPSPTAASTPAGSTSRR